MNKKILFSIVMMIVFITIFGKEKTYKFESGKICMEIVNSIFTTDSEIFFDDYGAKLCFNSNSLIEVNGEKQKVKISTILNDGKSYILNYNNKTYIEDIDEEEIDDIGIQSYGNETEGDKIGTEKILGRKCEIYQDGSSKSWVWNGFVLKQETIEDGRKMTMSVTLFDENFKIDKSLFEIPKDFVKEENPFKDVMMNLDQQMKESEKNQSSETKNSKKNTESEDPSKEELINSFKGLFK